jgi:hypothetical protein
VLCAACSQPSVRPALVVRLLGALGTLALTLFMLPLFGGAVFVSGSLVIGLLRGTEFDGFFAVVCAGCLVATSIGLWIPLRRFIEAVRPGAVRIELPVEEG